MDGRVLSVIVAQSTIIGFVLGILPQQHDVKSIVIYLVIISINLVSITSLTYYKWWLSKKGKE